MVTLVYGAYGYTGELIVHEALDRGLEIVVAGRNGTKTRGLAIRHDLESRVFAPEEARSNLEGVDYVLNCAGPFVRTYEPIVDACLETGTTYLDVTGELAVFEALAERDREAEKAGVALLPGVGFEVVPTDCLACHLHDRLPGASHLRLAVEYQGGLSGGTLATALEQADAGGKRRRDGMLEDTPVGTTREVDFGDGSRTAVSVPLGDLSTAYYTTGIGNVETFVSLPGPAARGARLSASLLSLLAVKPIRRGLQSLVRSVVDDPSPTERERGRASIWGEATDGERTVVSRLETPEPYTLTVDAATSALERLETMSSPPTGFETPAVAFDAEFVLGLDGVEGFFDE